MKKQAKSVKYIMYEYVCLLVYHLNTRIYESLSGKSIQYCMGVRLP